MEVLTTTIARFFIGAPLIIFGIVHFVTGTDMEGFMPDAQALFWVYLSGTALILSGTGILVKKFGKPACLLLAFMLSMQTLLVHVPAILDPNVMLTEIINTLKNLIIIGGVLACARIFINEDNKKG